MTSPVSQTSPHHWTYVAEGGSTIVFSYSGPRHLHFDGTVLRLRKSPISPASSATDVQIVEESDDPTVDFQQQVIQRVVRADFLPHLDHVRVERGWLETMVATHEHSRPLKRREKDGIDLARTKAVLATDLIGNHGWAVEIKPKWGFLPEPAHLNKHSSSLKTRICRFCMKKNTDNGAFRQAYCPLDLYSESEERIRTALYALWDDWVRSKGTINTLRIFVAGEILDPSSDTCVSKLAREIKHDETDILQLREKFASILLSILSEHPVLRTLSDLQRKLDPLDIEGLCRLCSDSPSDDYPHTPLPLPKGSITEDPDLKEWSSFLDFVSQDESLDHIHPEKSSQRYYLLAYLLSATFKDCSIIIRTHGDDAKSAAVTIIDLDAKSLSRLERWEALDRKVLSASMTDDRVCVDSKRSS